MTWVPKIRTGFDVLSVELSAEQGFVLAFIDGETDANHLAEMTDNDLSGITALLKQLVAEGVLEEAPSDEIDLAEVPAIANSNSNKNELAQQNIDNDLDHILGPVSLDFPDAGPDDWGDHTEVDGKIPDDDVDSGETDDLLTDATPNVDISKLDTDHLADELTDFANEAGDELFDKTPLSADFKGFENSENESADSVHEPAVVVDDSSDAEEEILVIADDDDSSDAEEEILVIADDDDSSDAEEKIPFVSNEEEIPFVDENEPRVDEENTANKSCDDDEAKIDSLPLDALQEAELFPFPDIGLAADILPVAVLAVYGELMEQEPSVRKQGAALSDVENLLAYALDPDPLVANALLANPGCQKATALFFAQHQHNPECLHELSLHSRLTEDAEIAEALLKNPDVPETVLPVLMAKLGARELAELAANVSAVVSVRQTAANNFAPKYLQLLPQDRENLLLLNDGMYLPMLAGQEIDEDTVDLLCQERFDSEAMLRALVAYAGTPLRLLQVLYRQPLTQENDDIKLALRAHQHWPK